MSDESLLQAAFDHAEEINIVNNPDVDPLEVWLTKDGSLTVHIPNELHSFAETKYLSENEKSMVCPHCHDPSILIKQRDNNWKCVLCEQSEKINIPEMVQPMLRSLPYSLSSIETTNSSVLSTEIGIMPYRFDDRKKQKKKALEKQKDVENSANELALDG